MYDDAYKAGTGSAPPSAELEERKAETRVAVREVLSLAADHLGGIDALVKWIRRDCSPGGGEPFGASAAASIGYRSEGALRCVLV